MSTHKNNRPDPPDELIQEALDKWMRRHLAEFATNLETARSMWRRFQELVEAPEIPEHLRAALVEMEGREPDDACELGEAALEPGYRESLLPDAIETARNWMKSGRSPNGRRLSSEMAAQYDAKFLSDLGISGNDPGSAS